MISIENLRQFRLEGYAVFDFVAAFIGIYLLSPLLSKLMLKLKLIVPKHSWLLLTLPLSIIFHLLFGNITLMTKDFLDLQGHYIIKIIILVLLILGLKDIKVAPQTAPKKRIK